MSKHPLFPFPVATNPFTNTPCADHKTAEPSLLVLIVSSHSKAALSLFVCSFPSRTTLFFVSTMDSASPTFDPDALTYRSFLPRSQHPSSASSPSIPTVPTFPELTLLQQELQHLSEKASHRYDRYSNELLKLEGGPALLAQAQSKESSVSSTPNALTPTSAASNTTTQGGVGGNAASAAANSSAIAAAARTNSASPVTASPSSFSSSAARTGGAASTTGTTPAGGSSPSIVKLGVVTLKLKRSDATGTRCIFAVTNDFVAMVVVQHQRKLTRCPSRKIIEDEPSTTSTPNTIKIRTGTPS